MADVAVVSSVCNVFTVLTYVFAVGIPLLSAMAITSLIFAFFFVALHSQQLLVVTALGSNSFAVR